MIWDTPRLTEIRMDAEITAYQQDEDAPRLPWSAGPDRPAAVGQGQPPAAPAAPRARAG